MRLYKYSMRMTSIFFLLIMTVVGSVVSANDIGYFSFLNGEVTIMRTVSSEKIKAFKGQSVFEKDLIEVASGGKARIILKDRTTLTLLPSTQVELSEFIRQKGIKRAEIQLRSGQIKAKVTEKYDKTPGSSFEIKTTTMVAGIRGTDFVVSFDPKTNNSEIITLEGAVEMANLLDQAKQMVPAGTKSVLDFQKRTMSVPQKFSDRDIQSILPEVQELKNLKQQSRDVSGSRLNDSANRMSDSIIRAGMGQFDLKQAIKDVRTGRLINDFIGATAEEVQRDVNTLKKVKVELILTKPPAEDL